MLGEAALLGTYTIVDRKFFNHTLKEIELGMSGLTFESGVLEAGCIENAQGYLFVEFGCLQKQETVKVKLVHCESSEIVWNCIGKELPATEVFEHIVSALGEG